MNKITAEDYKYYTTDHNAWRPWRLGKRVYYTLAEVIDLKLVNVLTVPQGNNVFTSEIKRLFNAGKGK